MRPTHEVPGVGQYRELTIWKAIVFGILTFGIYYLVLTYQNTKDIQNGRQEPFSLWPVFFWVGILFGPLHIVIYAFNGIGLNELRQRTGQSESNLWIAALVLAFVLPPIGEIIWAVHHNETVRVAAKGAPAQAAPVPPATMPA